MAVDDWIDKVSKYFILFMDKFLLEYFWKPFFIAIDYF